MSLINDSTKGPIEPSDTPTYGDLIPHQVPGTVTALPEIGTIGPRGYSNYQLAQKNGFTGTEQEYLNSLKGKDIYEIWLDEGNTGSLEEFLNELKGQDGTDGDDGDDGKSNYDLALESGYVGTVEEWLLTQIGPQGPVGKSNYDLAVEKGFVGTIDDYLNSLKGTSGGNGQDGTDGKSAYELAVDSGFSGTLSEWLISQKGDNGSDGKSAYQIALDNGFIGTESQWLESLKGRDGVGGGSGTGGSYSKWDVAANKVITPIQFIKTLTSDVIGSSGTITRGSNDLSDIVSIIDDISLASGELKFNIPDLGKSFILVFSENPILDVMSLQSSISSLSGFFIVVKTNTNEYTIQYQSNSSYGSMTIIPDETGYLSLDINESSVNLNNYQLPLLTSKISISIITYNQYIPAVDTLNFDISSITSIVQNDAILPEGASVGSIYEIVNNGFLGNNKFTDKDILILSSLSPLEFSILESDKKPKVHKAQDVFILSETESSLIPITPESQINNSIFSGGTAYSNSGRYYRAASTLRSIIDCEINISELILGNSFEIIITDDPLSNSLEDIHNTIQILKLRIDYYEEVTGENGDITEKILYINYNINNGNYQRSVEFNSFDSVIKFQLISGDNNSNFLFKISDASTDLIETQAFFTLSEKSILYFIHFIQNNDDTVKIENSIKTNKMVLIDKVNDFDYVDISEIELEGRTYNKNSYLIPYDNLSKSIILESPKEVIEGELGSFKGIYEYMYTEDSLESGDMFIYRNTSFYPPQYNLYIYHISEGWILPKVIPDISELVINTLPIVGSQDVLPSDTVDIAIAKLNSRNKAAPQTYGSFEILGVNPTTYDTQGNSQPYDLVTEVGSSFSKEFRLVSNTNQVSSGVGNKSFSIQSQHVWTVGNTFSSIDLSVYFNDLPNNTSSYIGLSRIRFGRPFDIGYNFAGILREFVEGSGYIYYFINYKGNMLLEKTLIGNWLSNNIRINYISNTKCEFIVNNTVSKLLILPEFGYDYSNNLTLYFHTIYPVENNTSIIISKLIFNNLLESSSNIEITNPGELFSKTGVMNPRSTVKVIRESNKSLESIKLMDPEDALLTASQGPEKPELPLFVTPAGYYITTDDHSKYPLSSYPPYRFPIGSFNLMGSAIDSSGQLMVPKFELGIGIHTVVEGFTDGLHATFNFRVEGKDQIDSYKQTLYFEIYSSGGSLFYGLRDSTDQYSYYSQSYIFKDKPYTLGTVLQLKLLRVGDKLVNFFVNNVLVHSYEQQKSFYNNDYPEGLGFKLIIKSSNNSGILLSNLSFDNYCSSYPKDIENYGGGYSEVRSMSSVVTTNNLYRKLNTQKIFNSVINLKYRYLDKNASDGNTYTTRGQSPYYLRLDTVSCTSISLSIYTSGTLTDFKLEFLNPINNTEVFMSIESVIELGVLKYYKVILNNINSSGNAYNTTTLVEPTQNPQLISIIKVGNNELIKIGNSNIYSLGSRNISGCLVKFNGGGSWTSSINNLLSSSSKANVATTHITSDDQLVTVKLLKTLGIIT